MKPTIRLICQNIRKVICKQNVIVLPPGQGRAVGFETVRLLPVGSDDVFCVFIFRTLRTRMTSSI